MFKIITIPFDRKTNSFDEEVLTRSILNKKIKSHRPQFFQDGGDKFWTIFLEYDPLVEVSSKRETEKLDEPQRILLERLKAYRKERAEKEGVPVYIVGTNRERIDIVRAAPKSLEALKSIMCFPLVPKLHLGTQLNEKFHFDLPAAGGTQMCRALTLKRSPSIRKYADVFTHSELSFLPKGVSK